MFLQNRYCVFLLTLFCAPAFAQFDAVIDSFRLEQALWEYETKVPTYQWPLKTGYQQSFQLARPDIRQIAGKKRNRSPDDVAEDERLDQWVRTRINSLKTRKHKHSGRLVIYADEVLHDRSWCRNCGVIIENGHITSVKPATAIQLKSGDVVHVYPTAILSPGFVDVLIHGANGHDVMHGTVESLHGIASKLVEEGTTAFLPSSMTASEEDMMKVARVVRESMQSQTPGQAKILGWHAEGPYFASEKIGCHDPGCRRNPDIDEVSQWQRASGYSLKVITIAPELDNALSFTRWASMNSIVVSIGHTMARCEQTRAAIHEGATMATHLYNAMNNGSHQRAGCSAAIKTDSRVFFTLIVDGLHIDPVNIEDLAARWDFTSRAILITDGIIAKYKDDGLYTFGGRNIVVNGKEARLEGKGNLAGSILKMNEAVANLLAYAPHISLEDALLMASFNPARAINVFHKGLVSEGYDADITLLDRQLNVQATYRAGRLAWQLSGLIDFYEYTVE